MGFLSNGLEDRAVKTIENVGAAAGFDYRLDTIDTRMLEFIDLAAGLRRRKLESA